MKMFSSRHCGAGSRWTGSVGLWKPGHCTGRTGPADRRGGERSGMDDGYFRFIPGCCAVPKNHSACRY